MDKPSPLPNRVTPFGEIVASPARGGMLGNRGGRIHEGYEIRRRQASPRWICCVLDFKNRRREVMGDGYTELFFLDEATALAAGHRPCFECRRADAVAFAAAWSNARGLDRRAMADEMDAVMKTERLQIGARGAPRTRIPAPEAPPRGAMVEAGGHAYLWDGAQYLKWAPDGYRSAQPVGPISALTSASVLGALRAGYQARIHPSAASA
ncbi:MAG: hypothetical protein AAF360_05950 [Pseudomonadota bacterium]